MKFDRIVHGTIRRRDGWRRHTTRVASREYLPFAAWLLAWAAITAAIDLHDAILLLAANGFVQSIRSLFLLQSFDAFSARLECPTEIRSRARRIALQVDTAALLGCLAMLVPVAIGVGGIGFAELATMMLVLALGLPARTPAVVMLDRRNIGTAWRIGSSIALLAGSGIVFLSGLNWTFAALAVAVREWGGFLAVWVVRGAAPATNHELPELGFAEIASRTSFAARRRLVYRIGKVTLSVLGPFGSIVARTGRGGGFDGRLAQGLTPNASAIGLLAAGCIAAAIATVLVNCDPPALLLSSALTRVAAASVSVLIWWRWSKSDNGFESLDADL